MLTHRMLEAFRAVILNGSISEAGEFLHISQPAVSRLIKDLEAEIGFRLFDRRHGRIFANQNAMEFYEEVHRSYIGLDSISQEAEQIRKRESGSLRIACLPAIGLSIMPKVIRKFQEKHPAIKISLQTVRSVTVIQFLTSLQCDIGFVEASFASPLLDEGPIYQLNSVCILPPGHRLTRKKLIKPEDLLNQPFISLDSDSRIRIQIDEIFKTKNIDRVTRIEAPSTNAVCSLVLEGCGISIVDPLTASSFANQGLELRPFQPKVTFSVRALTTSRVTGTSSVNEFYGAFSNTFSASNSS